MQPQDDDSAGSAAQPGWRFWIDRGGTFTDILAQAPSGRIMPHKVLSQTPTGGDATLDAIAAIRSGASAAERDAPIAEVRLGTTIATNTLLERSGARTVLVTAQGLGDVLAIGYQSRPDIFALAIERPSQLYERVIEVAGRLDAQGHERVALEPEAAEAALRQALADGFEACAIALPHAYLNPGHEAALAALARQLGFASVTASHEVSGLIGFIPRGSTAVVDAYVGRALGHYVGQVAAATGGGRLLCMKSDGGLIDARLFRGKDALLSGPAGGMIAAVATAQAEGFARVIGFDMGGTSTDVCHYAGDFDRRQHTEISGVVLHVPMLDVHTIAAGGGSIVAFDGLRLRVGPQSAGSAPGPASYGLGGPLTVTDCNVLLGRLQPGAVPAMFGADRDKPLDAAIVARAFATMAEAMSRATGSPWTPEQVASGALDIAIDAMAKAIRKLTIERGVEVDGHVLNSFGGAAGQHVCRVADALGVRAVLVHPYASILSAYGLALAPVTARRAATLDAALDGAGLKRAQRIADQLSEALRAELAPVSRSGGALSLAPTAQLKFTGTDSLLGVPLGPLETMLEAFRARYRATFGYLPPEGAVIIDSVSVEARLSDAATVDGAWQADQPALSEQRTARVWLDDLWRTVPLVERNTLKPSEPLTGPALIVDPFSTVVLEPGWTADVGETGALVLRRLTAPALRSVEDRAADPVRIALFNSLFMSIAEQMGQALRSTAMSTNIKERLDYSCAIFDAEARLIANAPHMPVHLGSMGASVEQVRLLGAKLRPGDVYMLNDPYQGGTHLPDVTVITPLFHGDAATPCAYLASRAHHADIGGITPGSMPPDSRTIDQEGVLIPVTRIVSAEQGFHDGEIAALLASARYPARNIAQNLADLRAQVAANAQGGTELVRAMDGFGRNRVLAFMTHVLDHAERLMRRALRALDGGCFSLTMDDGAVIAVTITVDQAEGSAVIDFTGTSAQAAGNFNAPRSVTRAAVLYVFRTLLADDVPLNDGVARPLTLQVPDGSMLSPVYPAAVVAGNVEVSQAVVDALYGALSVLANSQGTMNNLTFGNARHQYYETICGGVGAGPAHDGASAVHSHMTNSRLTDLEVLERQFPVRLERFAIRHGSGGAGQHRGGDGVERALMFLEPMTVSLLSGRRRVAPQGLAGGGDGAVGTGRIERADGSVEALAGRSSVEVEAGDRVIIETPGGGGYGSRSA
jgi:5-oxoprolinase (ATP-hydrolysing)